MNWVGFAFGFRFAAKEITDDFKRKCWETVFRAAAYADIRNMFLHEAQYDDPVAGLPIYIAIIGSPAVGPTQKNAELWRRDASLLGHMTFYRPFIQENYIELFAPSHSVGVFLPNGSVQPEEGIHFLPIMPEKKKNAEKKRKAVFLSRQAERENTDPAYASAMEKIAEHGPGFEITRLNCSEGVNALYHAAVSRKAMLYICSYKTGTGEKKETLYALLPGGRCLADVRALSDPDEVKEFLKTIVTWHGKGAEIFCKKEQNALMPEGCDPVNDISRFYRLQDALSEKDAAFCRKEDAAYFKTMVSAAMIEI